VPGLFYLLQQLENILQERRPRRDHVFQQYNRGEDAAPAGEMSWFDLR
jgi:hypothetical protein